GAIGLDDGGADGDAGGAGIEDALDVRLGNSADGEPGEVRGLGDGLDVGQPGKIGLGELLGGAGENGANAKIAGTGEHSGVKLRTFVGRDSDQQVRADDSPGVTDREILLPQVHSVGAGKARQVGPIVEDEPGLRLGGQDPDFTGTREELAIGQVLLAK